MENTGFAIALAWPQTFCKKSGSWYDFFAKILSIRKGDYYQVGHSALLLVDKKGNCKYYDFGRYHAPFQHGRVRSAATDFELKVKTKAVIAKNKIINFEDILKEIDKNNSCHGDGDLFASYLEINFEKAENRIGKFLEKECHQYGPLIWDGTNCSRFVQAILLAGISSKRKLFWKIVLAPTISATPLHLVKSLPNKAKIVAKEKVKLKSLKAPKLVLPPEEKPHHAAKWFAGEGAGSWIHIEENENHYIVKRYSDKLILESVCKMKPLGNTCLNVEDSFDLKFPVHCKEVHLVQNEQHIILKNKSIL